MIGHTNNKKGYGIKVLHCQRVSCPLHQNLQLNQPMISNLLTATVVSEQRITKLWKQLNATISLQQTNSVIWQIAIVKKEKEGEESGNLSINNKWINELSMSSCRYKKEERSNLRIRRKALESCDWMNLPPRNPFLSHIWWWWCDDGDDAMMMMWWWCRGWW